MSNLISTLTRERVRTARFLARQHMGTFASSALPSPTVDRIPQAGVETPLGRRIAAPGKVNLFLELTAKRPDGYHDLATLMATIDLYDELDIQHDPTGAISLECDDSEIPTDATNLACRAAQSLKEQTGCRLGCRIKLTKRIPSQAGLGGGSSDAAATLAVCNRLWNLNLTIGELTPMAAAVGSDVAFFLHGGAGLCTGRGEIVSPIVMPTLDIVLVKPNVGLSTAEVYRHACLPTHDIRDCSGVLAAVRSGDREGIARVLFNRLQSPAFHLKPSVAMVYERLFSIAPLACMLSGSGSSVFAVCRDRLDAERVAMEFLCLSPEIDPRSVFVLRTPAPT